jgi:hypothetical protein
LEVSRGLPGRPELLVRQKKTWREALEIRTDTGFVDFETSSDRTPAGMRMERQISWWKIVQTQIQVLHQCTYDEERAIEGFFPSPVLSIGVTDAEVTRWRSALEHPRTSG